MSNVASNPTPDAPLSLEAAIERLQRIQRINGTRPWRLVIRKFNPGGLTAHQTTEVRGLYAGIDWQAGQVIVEPTRPLTELTDEQVEAIHKSVREGSSWHAYQREKKLRDRIQELEAENASLRASAATPSA